MTDAQGAEGRFFDGRTSRAHAVRWECRGDTLRILGETELRIPLSVVEIPEPTPSAPRRLGLPGGGMLEVEEGPELAGLLARAGARDAPWLRVLGRPSWSLFFGLLFVAGLALGYLFGLPAAARLAAGLVPQGAERSLGAGTLEMLDRHVFTASTLTQQRQDAITNALAALRLPPGGRPAYRLLFRHSRYGPNAFTLPSGYIILTDEIVSLAPADDAVLGVLAHELGHLRGRHALRSFIQATAVGAVVGLLLGDTSTVLMGFPALVLDLKYSRDFEREADDYAIATLHANGLSTAGLARVLRAMQARERSSASYLSSHPPTDERIAHLLESAPQP